MQIKFIIIIILFPFLTYSQLYKVSEGSAKFISDAPLELIKAQSTKLNGLLKISNKTFAFTVPMSSFEGFNSSLQRTHFNENYVESSKFPDATFEGKIIEDIDFSVPGNFEIRGKGKFTIHGVEQTRIIKCNIIIQQNKILIKSKFSVMLADHNITIPSVVSKKITEEVVVEINIVLVPKN